jgi:hypothetical protein
VLPCPSCGIRHVERGRGQNCQHLVMIERAVFVFGSSPALPPVWLIEDEGVFLPLQRRFRCLVFGVPSGCQKLVNIMCWMVRALPSASVTFILRRGCCGKDRVRRFELLNSRDKMPA